MNPKKKKRKKVKVMKKPRININNIIDHIDDKNRKVKRMRGAVKWAKEQLVSPEYACGERKDHEKRQ